MKTTPLLSKNKLSSLLLILAIPFATLAEQMPTAEEEAAQNEQMALYTKIAIAVVFAASVAAFLIYKTKHEKTLREKHIEQMKKIQANKKKAA